MDIGREFTTIVGKILEHYKYTKQLPDIKGTCECGYEGSFKYLDSKRSIVPEMKYYFANYKCPSCKEVYPSDVYMGSNVGIENKVNEK